jgi:hypothetical protein
MPDHNRVDQGLRGDPKVARMGRKCKKCGGPFPTFCPRETSGKAPGAAPRRSRATAMSRRPIVVRIISNKLDLYRQCRQPDRATVDAVADLLEEISANAQFAVKSIALGSWIVDVGGRRRSADALPADLASR